MACRSRKRSACVRSSALPEFLFIEYLRMRRFTTAAWLHEPGSQRDDDSAELQIDSAQTVYTLTSLQLAELPTTSTTGRNFQSLYRLVPGSTPPAEQNSAGSNPQRFQSVNVNGVSNSTNTTRIDGSIDAYPWLAYLAAYLPTTDAIESINVVTGSFNAEQGVAGSSAINVRMKSETNKFMAVHGGTIPSPRRAESDRVRQKNIYNEDGASFGGPIVRNKLFSSATMIARPACRVSRSHPGQTAFRQGQTVHELLQ